MKPIGLFYGSDGGNTESIALKIKNAFGDHVELFNVTKVDKTKIAEFENIILATPTYGEGELQRDWNVFLSLLNEDDFAGKCVAYVGVGDQDEHSETFCDALFLLYKKTSSKATVIGATTTDGYNQESSKAIINDQFIGLILDEENQGDLTDERIEAWVAQIQPLFA